MSTTTVEDGRRYGVRVSDPLSIYVAGEALIDLVPEPSGVYRAIPGGSPANVAVGLAKLGAPTQLLARLGTGPFGRVIREHLEKTGIGLDHMVDAAEPATLAVVSLDEPGQPTYNFYAHGTADWGWRDDELPDRLPAEAQALVTGSIAVAREPGAAALTSLINREHARGQVTVVLDPNLRPALLGPAEDVRARWNMLIELADVVKVSDEDLAWLAPGTAALDVATDWVRRGPALVVVTRGGDGATGIIGDGVSVDVPALKVDVVDTIGAGDAFTAGLVDSLRLAGLLSGANRPALTGLDETQLRRILERAALVAAMTCEHPGADPPTADAVRRRQ